MAKFKFSIVLLLCFYFLFASGQTQTKSSADSIEVAKSLDHFVDAFTALKWNEFASCFANDATAFFPPSARVPERANNKMEIEKIFRKVFDNAQKGRSSPPYLDIHPRDMRIQMLGDVAIATFHLNDPDLFGRRTIVLKRERERWLIVHLHASGIASDRQ